MPIPIQITLRQLSHSQAVEKHIQEKAQKLEHFCDHIIHCHVVVELANHNQHHGNLYNTRITVKVPKDELIATHNGEENMYLSIQEAFSNITRQLENYREKLQNNTSHRDRETMLTGKIARIDGGFGFIEGSDGAEFYFNAKHVISPAFDKLTVNMPVCFVALESEQGPEARRVKQLRK